MTELVEIDLSLLDDHPKNPRVVYREDVIDAIAAGMNGNYPKQHALHVRPIAERFQILSGHHRKRGAEKHGIKKVWCWVEKLDDDAAYMALATSNNQGELSPLEIGFHALNCVTLAQGKKGGGLAEYAELVGKGKSAISEYRNAAAVALTCSLKRTSLLDKAKHLAEIHGLPEACWPACVRHVVDKEFSAAETREAVKTAKLFHADFKPPKQWGKYLNRDWCTADVFGGRRPAEFGTLAKLATDVHESLKEHADLQEQWTTWLNENADGDSWEIRKVQAKRIELDTIRLEREEEPPVEGVQVLLADPPWKYDFAETGNRQIENQYPTATVEEICDHCNDAKLFPALADDAVLFMWATAPKLREALKVMDAWGFEYKTNAVWDKEKIGMGYWFRGQHELLLVGTRGSFSPPENSDRFSSVFREERKAHSAKPKCVYEALVEMFPNVKRFEMYQRTNRKEWPGSGNEA